jgi:hypothetical protein
MSAHQATLLNTFLNLTAWMLISAEISAAPPSSSRGPRPTATPARSLVADTRPIDLDIPESGATLGELVRQIRERSGLNLLLAPELRDTRAPEIHLSHVAALDALRALEKVTPGVSLDFTSGPKGLADPGTIFRIFPSPTVTTNSPSLPPRVCSVFKSHGHQPLKGKALDELVKQIDNATKKACDMHSKTPGIRKLSPPSVEAHPATGLLIVAGEEPAVSIAAQVIQGLGGEALSPSYSPLSAPHSLSTARSPQNLAAPITPGSSGVTGKTSADNLLGTLLPQLGISLPSSPSTSKGFGDPSPAAVPPENLHSVETGQGKSRPLGSLEDVRASHLDAARRLQDLQQSHQSQIRPIHPISPIAPIVPALPKSP